MVKSEYILDTSAYPFGHNRRVVRKLEKLVRNAKYFPQISLILLLLLDIPKSEALLTYYRTSRSTLQWPDQLKIILF